MSAYCNNCFCCGYYLISRYKRLVNNIFLQDPEHGPDKNNLERLRFYAVRKPDKLHKSFRYMSEKIARYLRHRDRPYVILGITAMNDTMKSCYQQLNTFVDYYLATLHLVLEERDDLELTEHAITSFESFCEIREEAPNYQRDYAFFVDRFTQLCHSNDRTNKKKCRCLGLRGHHALILKTANDELQNDVWKHMDQIIPSIIFNIKAREQEQSKTKTVSIEDVTIEKNSSNEDTPSILAEIILKDLFNRAHVNHLPTCIRHIFRYLDDHNKWTPVVFPKYIFSEIMNSIKSYNSYVIIDLLLNYLEKQFEKKETTRVKISIVKVVHDYLVFAATNTGAGSTMFTGLSRLLKCLEKSFQIESKRSKTTVNNEDEQQFQQAVSDGIGDFAEKVPDFQVMEIMHTIVISSPILNQSSDAKTKELRDAKLKFQLLLLRTIQKIAASYHSKQHHETTFPHQLFDLLLKMMNTSELDIRLIVLEILLLLIDKRHYADKLRRIRIPKDISQLNLPTETKTTRLVDIAFMKKYGSQFLSQLYNCILMNNNTKDIFHVIYCLMNIVTIEAGDQDVLVDIIRFCFEIQSTIMKIANEGYTQLSRINCYYIHALIVAYFNLMSKSYNIIGFSQHVDDIIDNRELRASYLLPPNAFRSISNENLSKHFPKDCLFVEEIVRNALKTSHYDISRFNRSIPYKSESNIPADKNNNETETDDSLSSRTDLRNDHNDENISYETVRNILNTNESIEENKRLRKEFRTKPFQELKSNANEKQKQTQHRIDQVLNVRDIPNNPSSDRHSNRFDYPELFTY